MKFFKTISLSLILLAVFAGNAQSFKQRLKKTTFVFGLSEHIVIDNGKEYQFKFNTKGWQLTPFPSKISAEAYIKKGWSFLTEFAYTKYKINSIVDNYTLKKDNSFFSADLNIRYHFETLFLHPSFFDPFLTAGYGFTYRSGVNSTQTAVGTTNLGLGCNFWIYKGFGISLQSVGKFALKGGSKSNYLQHSFGLVYKLQPLAAAIKAAKSKK